MGGYQRCRWAKSKASSNEPETYRFFGSGGRSDAVNAVWESSSSSSSTIGVRLSVAQSFPPFAAVISLNLYASLSIAAWEGMLFLDDLQVAGG
jgi:hypothetical protein